MAAPAITQITYRIAQGDITPDDLASFVDYAAMALANAYPKADITVEAVRDDPDAGLSIELREHDEDDPIGFLYREREDAEAYIDDLWNQWSRLYPPAPPPGTDIPQGG